MKRLAILLTVTSVLLFCAALVCGYVAIWVDGSSAEWAATAWLTVLAGFVPGSAAGFVWIEVD